jgi:L-malate glycosyltransferase
LRPVKGLDLLLDAAARLTDDYPDLVCQIAGEGEMRGALEASARQRGLADRFRLLGSVADVPAFLAGLDIAVLPSRSEGMSNALLEYMAAGRAIVATSVGAAAELIDDGVHGLLVPPNDAGKLAEAIDRLLKNPGLAHRIGKAARRRVRERYSREAMVERFTDFYERLSA